MVDDVDQQAEREVKADPAGWVDRHGDSLYRYALLKLGDPDRAADVVQETFLHALRSSGAFAGRSSERTWLVGILKHKVADHHRSATRQRAEGDGRALAAEFDRRGRWTLGPLRWGGDAGRAVETGEFWDVFGSCLGELPGHLADAFLLRELDELDAREIQGRLGITPANLWARLHRARSLLRRCLEIRWFGPDARTPGPQARSSTPNRKARPADGPIA